MPVTDDLITRFRLLYNVADTAVSDDVITQWLNDAVLQHNPNYTLSILPVAEYNTFLLLVLEKYHLFRAAQAAKGYPVSTPGHGYTDKSRAMQNHYTAAREAREEYERMAALLGFGRSQIFQSRMKLRSRQRGHIIPVDMVVEPAVSTLSITATAGSGKLVFVWTEKPITDFLCYRLYWNSVAGLKDMASLTRSGAAHKGVVDAATVETTISQRWKTTYEILNTDENFPAGTTAYFVLVTENTTGRVSVSNEVSGTMPASS